MKRMGANDYFDWALRWDGVQPQRPISSQHPLLGPTNKLIAYNTVLFICNPGIIYGRHTTTNTPTIPALNN